MTSPSQNGFSILDLDRAQVEVISQHEIRAIGEGTNNALDAQVFVNDELESLALLPTSTYESQRKIVAKKLGWRTSQLDKHIERRRKSFKGNKSAEGAAIILPEIPLWPKPVEGKELFSAISAAIRSYVVMPESAADLAALWVIHTHIVDCFPISPRLAAQSPVMECGKTTFLRTLRKLVCRPLPTSNIQPAGIFRTVEKYHPTLIIDEGDLFLRDNEPLRGVLNSGHCQGEFVVRVEGDPLEPRTYKTFGACAFGLIGKLPDTLESRSIKIPLKRATQEEQKFIKRFRSDRTPELDELASMTARWATDNEPAVRDCDPDMGDHFNRNADNLRTLFAIADVAGGVWPHRARQAAALLFQIDAEQSQLIILLSDIRDVFKELVSDRVKSADLVEFLIKIEGRPWAEWKNGRPISPTSLARLLATFKIRPATKRAGTDTFKGYLLSDFAEVFERYLPSPAQTVTPSQNQQNRSDLTASGPSHLRTCYASKSITKTEETGACDGVTVQSHDEADGWWFNKEDDTL
jgi:hypothetical protein